MNLDRVCSWFATRERIVFTGLLLLHVAFLWSFTYIPTQDGPSHLYNANVILKYFHPEYPVFREYHVLNTGVWSNWLGHGILAGLISLFPLLIAEKVFVSGYVIAFPLAVRYALRGIRPEAGVLSFLSFPVIYSYAFQMGFWSFCYSLPVFFLILGYWFRCRDLIGTRAWTVIATLAVFLCLFHILSFLMACLFIGVLSLMQMFSPRRCLPSPGLPPTWGAWDIFRFQALPTATALLPALLLAALFVFGQGEGHSGIPGGGNPLFFPKYLLKQFMALSSFWIWEVAIYGGFGVLILWIAIRNWQKNNTIFGWNGFLILILVCLSILYVAPEGMSGGSEIPPRLILFLLASLFFWLGLHIQRDGEKMAIMVVSFAISLGLLISHGVKYQELNKYLEEYVSGSDRVEMNATLLPICFSPKGFSVDNTFHTYPRTSPFIHASGYIAARRHVVIFTNFEARMSFFPTRFRPGLNPYIHIGPVETIDKQIDFLSYPSRTGGRVDYVLVWGKNRGDYPPEVVESIAEQIREGYELIFTSERGSMMLYRRKGWPPEIDEGPVRRHTSGQRGGNYPVAEIVPHGRPGSPARPQVVPGLELEPVAAQGTGEGSESRSIVPGVVESGHQLTYRRRARFHRLRVHGVPAAQRGGMMYYRRRESIIARRAKLKEETLSRRRVINLQSQGPDGGNPYLTSGPENYHSL